ncbi:MAG: PAS domain S-box protein [Cytophagales bacterium]|nr:MAG: PAS domain S-box protein [Cytophagales bacterium]
MTAPGELNGENDRYRILFKSLDEGVVFHDGEGKIIDANKAAQKILGLSLNQLTGLDSFDPSWHAIYLDGSPFPGEEHPAQIALKTGKSVKKVTMGVFNPILQDYKWIIINAIPSNLSSDEKPNLVSVFFSDITNQIRAQKKLEEETKLNQTLVEVSSSFINLSEKEIRLGIQTNLERLGKFVEADRIYIFEYDWESHTTSNTYEWCADGIEPQIEYLQNYSMEGMEHWGNSHKKGEPIYVEEVAKLDPEDQLRKTLEPQGIQSILTMPIMYQSQCLGFLGLDSVKKIHRYSEGELSILRIFSDILSNVHSRFLIEKNERERQKELRAIYQVSALGNDSSVSINDLLQRSAGVIQAGFLNPEETSVQISWKTQSFQTDPFLETGNSICRKTELDTGDWFFLNVFIKENDRFLKEEYDFIETILYTLQQAVNSRENLTKIQESQSRLQSLLNSQTNYIIRTDLQGLHTFWNRKFEEDFGYLYTNKGLHKSDSLSSICTYDVEKAIKTVEKCMANPGKSYQVELDKPNKNGSIMTTRWEFVCLTDSFGNPYEMQCEGLDISDIKKAEKELKESEKKYKFLFEEAPDGYLVIKDGVVVECNHTSEKMIGGTRENLLGKHAEEISPEYQPDGELSSVKARKILKSAKVNQIEKFEWLNKRIDGTEFLSEVKLAQIEMDGEMVLFAAWKDITESRKMQKALEDSEKRFSQIAEHSGAVIWETDDKGLYTYISPVSKIVFGYEPEELIGKKYFYDLFPPEYFEEFKTQGLAYLHSGKSLKNWENPIQRKDGEIIWVETFGTSIIDKDGVFRGYRGSDSNITQRKQYEREILELNQNLETRIEERTRELEKAKSEADSANRAKSEFLSRMSHELRTPMNSILGFAQLMEYTPLRDDQKRNIEYILKSGNHLLNLINEVLYISSIEAGKISIHTQSLEVGGIIQEVTESLLPIADQKGIKINFNSEIGTPNYVNADPHRLKQILFNLINNAIKYNKPNGVVNIRITPESKASSSTQMTRISVEDSGIGIKESAIEKLFNPFERGGLENSSIEGTGLGLSVVKKFIILMEGDVGVKSQIGVGSTFWIDLPTYSPNPQGDFAFQDIMAIEKSNIPLEILLVEDNEVNIQLISALINNANPNHEIIETKFGKEALGLAISHRPDLILLDLRLNDSNGKEVLKELKHNQSTQSIPVIIISADTDSKQLNELKCLGADHYITKPIDWDKLMQLILSHNKLKSHE